MFNDSRLLYNETKVRKYVGGFMEGYYAIRTF